VVGSSYRERWIDGYLSSERDECICQFFCGSGERVVVRILHKQTCLGTFQSEIETLNRLLF